MVLTITASGSVSDYDDISSLRCSISSVAGVDPSAVTITVAAASVLITAIIAVPTSTTTAAVQTSLSSSLGTAATASTALGVTVESVPTITVVATQPPDSPSLLLPPPAPPHQSPPSVVPRPGPSPPPAPPTQPLPSLDTIGGQTSNIASHHDGDAALVSGAVAAAVGTTGMLIAALFCRRRRRRQRRQALSGDGIQVVGTVERASSSCSKMNLGTVQIAGVYAVEHGVPWSTPADLGVPTTGMASTVRASVIDVLEGRGGDAVVVEAAVVSARAHKRHAAARLQRWWRCRRSSPSSRTGSSPMVRVHHTRAATSAELSVVPLPLVDATACAVDPRVV